MASTTYDVAVIGAGPGGYVAAIRAAQLGLKTVVIEREHLGGICLNWGCIPTKALLRSSEIFHLMHRAKEFGLKAENVGFDIDAVVERSRAVAKQLSGGVGFLMKKNKIAVVMGEAKLPARARSPSRPTRAPRRSRPRRSSSPPAPAPATCRASRRTASGSGPTSTRWCRRTCRSSCWSSARAPSASSSPASTTPWAPRRRWSRCCRGSCPSRTRRSPPSPGSSSRSRG